MVVRRVLHRDRVNGFSEQVVHGTPCPLQSQVPAPRGPGLRGVMP